MTYLFAPLEGLTGYIYRNTHAAYFSPADEYFTPFLSPNQNRRFTSREKNDVLPEHNQGLHVVPQLLTNQAEHFLWAAGELAAMGYAEVNLNLGCPSGTVVAKKKGSGFLTELEALDRFLDEVCAKVPCAVSVKTRLGRYSPDEFPALLEIFNRYPLKRLMIHPRVQTDFYRNHANLDAFAAALAGSRHPVCFNGDLFTPADVDAFRARFPQVQSVMLGRGLLANPGLLGELRGGTRMDKATLRAFHDELLGRYQQVLSGERPVLHKMKELWFYMHALFAGCDAYLKPLRKAAHLRDYEAVVTQIFANCALDPAAGYRGGS